MTPLGRHLIAELTGCAPDRLADLEQVRGAMLAAAEASGATIVTHTFHHFSPLGVSGMVIIAESHLAIHTWPEHRFAAVDFFSCINRVEPEKALDTLRERLGAEGMELLRLERGPLSVGDQRPALVGQEGLLDR